MTKEEIEALSPGISGAVLWLRSLGFNTIDSGDGSNHEQGMECAIPDPMIAIKVAAPSHLIHECDSLRRILVANKIPFSYNNGPGIQIQGTYDPVDIDNTVIVLIEYGDKGYLSSIYPDGRRKSND